MRSLAATSDPSGAHSACGIDSPSPPARVRAFANVPSAVISATRSSVASQGMSGWFHTIHAARAPSRLTRGPVVNRYASSVSSRTAPRSPAAEPSSGTAATTRRTCVGRSPVNSSRTAHTSLRSGENSMSHHRSPPGNRGTGVRGRGPRPASGSTA